MAHHCVGVGGGSVAIIQLKLSHVELGSGLRFATITSGIYGLGRSCSLCSQILSVHFYISLSFSNIIVSFGHGVQFKTKAKH